MIPEFRQLQDAGDVDRRWWETDDGSRPPANQQAGPGQPPGWGFGPPPPPPALSLNKDWPRTADPRAQETDAPEPATTSGIPAGTDLLASGAAPADTAGSADTPASTATAAQAISPTQANAAAQADADALTMQRLELELAAAHEEAAALHEMLEDLPEIFERKFRQRLQSILEQQQRLLADNQALREQVYRLAAGAPAVETRPSRLLPAAQPSLPELSRRSPLGEALRKVLRLGRQGPPVPNDPDRCG